MSSTNNTHPTPQPPPLLPTEATTNDTNDTNDLTQALPKRQTHTRRRHHHRTQPTPRLPRILSLRHTHASSIHSGNCDDYSETDEDTNNTNNGNTNDGFRQKGPPQHHNTRQNKDALDLDEGDDNDVEEEDEMDAVELLLLLVLVMGTSPMDVVSYLRPLRLMIILRIGLGTGHLGESVSSIVLVSLVVS